MKSLSKASSTKPSTKLTTAPRRSSASTASPSPAPAVTPTAEGVPRLCSNRPVKSNGSGRSTGAETTPAAIDRTEATATASVTAPAALPNPPSSRSTAPAKLLPCKSHTAPATDTNSNSNDTNTNYLNIGSSCSSLQLLRPTSSRDATPGNCEEGDAGITESTQSYLTRLSLEDAVVALERLRFLMMSHTAAVTGSQSGSNTLAEMLSPPPQQMHVDPFKLSKRPLEVIAEELCSQLRRLTTAYAVASAADRCLLGVSETHRRTMPLEASPLGGAGVAGRNDNASNSNSNSGDDGDLLGTFGPMVSTQRIATTRSNSDDGNFLDSLVPVETDDSWGVIDLHKPNPGPRIAYSQGEDSEIRQDFGSTVYKYPNGTVVSYPMSTFGELISTESGQGTTYRSRGATLLGTERRITVSDGTQTDDTLEPTKKERDLQAYVKALEARLTEKQRLEAIRESRGVKKSGISEALCKLARSVEYAQPETDKQTPTAAHMHEKSSVH